MNEINKPFNFIERYSKVWIDELPQNIVIGVSVGFQLHAKTIGENLQELEFIIKFKLQTPNKLTIIEFEYSASTELQNELCTIENAASVLHKSAIFLKTNFEDSCYKQYGVKYEPQIPPIEYIIEQIRTRKMLNNN